MDQVPAVCTNVRTKSEKGGLAPELTLIVGPLPLAAPTQGPTPHVLSGAHTCQVDGDPTTEEAESHMSEEAAVIEKPVRPGREGGRKKMDSGGRTGGRSLGRRGRENGPVWGTGDLCEDPNIHPCICPPPCSIILYHPPPFTIHPSTYPSVRIQPYSHPSV